MTWTGSTLKAKAEQDLDAGTTIAEESAIIWINELLDELGADCKVPLTTALTITTAGTSVSLPDDYLDFYYMKDSDGEIYEEDVTVRYSEITVWDEDTYVLSYYPIPPSIGDIAETVSIHTLLGNCAAKYIASRYKSQDDDENRDAQRLYQEYLAMKAAALKKINKIEGRNPNRIKDVYGGLDF